MKKLVACLAVAGALVAMSSESQAAYCRARSPTGSWGWGRSPSAAQASGIALAECAVRTPRGYRCYITGCTY